MKIEILESARRDLVEGFLFYEKQADGIGSYFLNSLYADIESLVDMPAFTPFTLLSFTVSCHLNSLLQFITECGKRQHWFTLCWTVEENLHGFDPD